MSPILFNVFIDDSFRSYSKTVMHHFYLVSSCLADTYRWHQQNTIRMTLSGIVARDGILAGNKLPTDRVSSVFVNNIQRLE